MWLLKLFIFIISCFLFYQVVANYDILKCYYDSRQIKIGMSRAAVDRIATQDGGLSGMHTGVRYIVYDKEHYPLKNERVCMVTVDFSDKRSPKEATPSDPVIKVSEPRLDYQNGD